MELTNIMVRIMADPFRTAEEMEYLCQKGIRPVINDGMIVGWEVQSSDA